MNKMIKPNIFLLGAPKCGTTTLAGFFEDHPLILAAKPKEPHYFCKDLKAGGLPVSSDEDYIQTFFPSIDQSNVIAAVDTSVWYLYSEKAIHEIVDFNSEARFIVMIRNPVDMVWSLHSMLNFQRQEDQYDFMTAWNLQDEREKGIAIPSGLWLDKKMLLYKDVCSLGSQLKRALSFVDQNRVHVELLDDLKENPHDLYLRVLDFMNVPDDKRINFTVKNESHKLKNPVLVKLLRSRAALKSVVMLKGFSKLKTLGFGRPDLVIPQDIRSFLVEEFNYEIAMLEEILARDLSSWREM